MNDKTIRPGFPTATPYLVFNDAAAAIAFYQRAFGAVELSRLTDPSGRVVHAEVMIGNSPIMLSSTDPRYPFCRSADAAGGSTVHLFLYVDEVDARFQRALDAGAQVVMPLAEQPYGRSGGVKDPFGVVWWLSTHKEQPPAASAT